MMGRLKNMKLNSLKTLFAEVARDSGKGASAGKTIRRKVNRTGDNSRVGRGIHSASTLERPRPGEMLETPDHPALKRNEFRAPFPHRLPLLSMVTAALLVVGAMVVQGAGAATKLKWTELPPVPDKEGFAAPFVGVSNGALIVAGGANFPDGYPWEDGKKVWYDSVFVLEKPNAKEWKTGFKLPGPVAYGISITTDKGLLCIGGGDSEKHVADVFQLEWKGGEIRTTTLPSLPKPCAFGSGVRVDNTVYVAGGIEKPSATRAMKNFWSLNLKKTSEGWQEHSPWPGPARMLAVAASADKAFHLISGTSLAPDAEGKAVRTYLKDGWSWTKKTGWIPLADIPASAVASPSPAPVIGDRHILVICGDDGSKVGFEPLSKHPGFPKRVLAYDVHEDAWSKAGKVPFSIVTVPVAEWNGRFVIANGEARPGVRSPKVWQARIPGKAKGKGKKKGGKGK